MEPVLLAAFRRHAVDLLGRAGVPTPEADADLLIGHILGLGRGQVQAKAITGARLGPEDLLAAAEALERRAAREPLQHITGRAAFRSLELAVGPGVFVPRPETEGVAQLAIDAVRAVPGTPIAVDLGTGSGAIALSIATEVPHAEVHAVENSPRAFVWAKQNVRRLGGVNTHLVFDDIAVALPKLDGRVDVVVSNPPYVPLDAVPRDPEVRLHDPAHALYGGRDGLDVVRQVSLTGMRLLRTGGTLIIEHGDQQAESLRALLTADGWRAAATHRDLLGRDRATTALR